MDSDAIRKLRDEATPGPWRVQRRYSFISHHDSNQVVWDVPKSTALSLVADTGGLTLSNTNDARLIAAAPDLAAEVLRLRAEVEDLISDIARGKAIESELATDNERLRADLAVAREALKPIAHFAGGPFSMNA